MTSLADATAAGGAEPTVTAVRPDGVAVTLPQSSVPRALELGYQIENAEGTALRKRHAEFATVGHELASAGLGAARGISFGTSDLALRASGLVKPETLRAYAEENPTASALGEAGGILGLPLAVAIGGTVGAAAGVAGAGVAAAGAVGEAAAGLAAKAAVKLGLSAADSLALDALGGVAQGAVRGAAEGSLYGLGQGVSNVAMRDEKDLGSPAAIGQVLLAHAGMGAVLGSAISGAVGGVTSLGVSGTRRVLRALGGGRADSLSDTAAAVADTAGAAAAGDRAPAGGVDPAMAADVAAKPAPPPADSGPVISEAGAPPVRADAPPAVAPRPGIIDRLRDRFLGVAGAPAAMATSLTSGVDEAFISRLAAKGEAGKRLRKVAFEGDDIVSDQTRALTKTITGLEDDGHIVMNATLGQPKSETMGNAMRKGNLQAQLDGAMAQVNRAADLIEQARDVQYEGAGEGSLKRFEKAVLAARAKLLRLGEEGENSANAGREAYTAIDTLKKRMGKVAKPGGMLSSDQAAVAQLFRDDYNSGIQKFLEDRELWGGAADIQRDHNGTWVGLLDKKQVFDQTFMTDLGRHPGDEFWTTRRVADPARVNTFLADAGHVRNDLKSSVALEQVEALRRFAQSARDNFELSAEARAAADRIVANAPKATSTIRQAIEDAGTRNLAKQLQGTVTGKAFALMARLDNTLGVGAPVRDELRAELRRTAEKLGREQGPAAAEKLVDVAERIHAEQVRQAELGNVGKILRTTIRAIGHLVDQSVKLTERAERVAIPVAISQAKRYALELPSDDRDDPNDRGAGAQLRRQLRALHRYTAQPSDLAERVSEATQGLAAVAPQTAAEVATAAGAAMAHLNGIAPRPTDYGLSPGLRADWQPTTTQAAAFSNALRAIMHPMSVPEDMAAGTLTRDGVQALAAVYPGLHDMIATMLAVRLQRAKSIPLQRRLQLSALWNLQTDAMVDPAFASMVQGSYTPQPPPRAAAGASYNSTDRTALRREVATPTQRIGA